MLPDVLSARGGSKNKNRPTRKGSASNYQIDQPVGHRIIGQKGTERSCKALELTLIPIFVDFQKLALEEFKRVYITFTTDEVNRVFKSLKPLFTHLKSIITKMSCGFSDLSYSFKKCILAKYPII